MKIVHFVAQMDVGGIETMIVDIANVQVRLHDVSIVILNNIIDDTVISKLNTKIKVLKVGRRPKSYNFLYVLKCNFYFFKLLPDLIHCHADIGHWIIPSLYKTVLTVHCTSWNIAHITRYDKIFVISYSVEDYLHRVLDISNHKIAVINNGIPCSAISRAHSSPKGTTFKICQIGRLSHKQKGQDIFLNAIQLLIYFYGVTNIQVDFIGDGESRKYLQLLAKEYQIENYCNFLGKISRDNLYRTIQKYHLLVQPSRYEGFGLTVVEAMVAEVAVLVTNIEGPMEIINNGEFGYSFKSEDAESCAVSILHIINQYNTPNFLDKLKRARMHAMNKYDVNTTANRYLQEYLSVSRSH